MRLHLPTSALLWTLLLASPLAGQDSLAELLDDPATQLARPADRARVVKRMAEIETARQQQARDRATQRGLPLRTMLGNGRIHELVAFDGERPRYFTTYNVNAAISTGANLLRAAPYALTGAGVTIGLWDGGAARATHQELTGRVTVMDGASIIDHASHVGATLIASGVVAAAHGMAAGATVNSYDWTNDTSEMTARAATAANQATKIYLSNHSYGIISGWDYVNGGTPYRTWEWYGSGTTASSIENEFGLYNTSARDSDSLAFNAPYYLMFRAAGNDRADNPSTGSTVALSPGGASVVSYDPAAHPGGDGTYRGGFDAIGFEAVAKNGMTVGSVADAVSGSLRNVSNAANSYFSCWGPTDDGRIKPDLVANGENLYSSLGTSDSAYASYSGTSMATPNAVGSASLLIQQYSNLFPSQAMRASTLKGLLIHTATDLGNPGPDYKAGWGLLDVQAAADLLRDHQAVPAKQRLTENQLTSTTLTRSLTFVWDGLSPIAASLCWTDPAASALTAADSRSSRLVNNLNLKIIAPNGSEFLPYVMPFVGTWTQPAMDAAATTGVNNTDNVEQVRIAAPPVAGTYQVVVSVSGTLTNNSQYYSLLLSGTSAEAPPPPAPPANLAATPGNNQVTLSWSAASGATGYTVKRALASGGPYATLGSTATTSYIDASVTNGTTYYYVVSASNGSGEGADSGQLSAIPLAQPSTTTLASTPATAGAYGSAVAFVATVSASASGTVTFKEASTVLGTAALSAGTATYTTSALAVGQHAVTAYYAGDATFGASNSGPLGYTVNPKSVTISGVTGANKVYDATTGAILTGGSVAGLVSGDSVTVAAGSGAFASPNAGSQPVIASGYALAGASAGNYVLSAQPAVASALIAPRPLQLTGTRVYDGTTVASAAGLAVANNLDGADLTLTGSANLAGRNVGLQAVSSGAGVARVQSATGNTGTSAATTFNVTLGSTPVAGNTLVAVISTRGTSANRVSSIAQTGATWTRASQAANTNGTTTEIWFAPNVSAAAKIVTVNQASLRSAAVVIEYAGILDANPVDQTSSATGNSTAPVTGTTPSTTQANEVWLGGIGFISSTPSLGTFLNSFSLVDSARSTRIPASSNAEVYALERLVNPSEAASSGGTLSTSAQWSGSIATFKTEPPSTLAPAGPAAANYTTTGASGSVLVTARPLTVAAVNTTKTYDGTTIAAGTPTLIPPLAAGDSTSVLSQAFQSSGAGTANKVIVPSIVIDDANGGANYAVTLSNWLTGTILPAVANLSLGNLTPIYNGSPQPVTVTTIPTGLAVALAYDDSATAPSAAGSYAVSATVTDPNHTGSAAGTLVIGKAPATIDLTDLAQTYDGLPKPITATTTPAGLAVVLTYNGSATAPSAAGSYAISATVTDPNHTGSAAATLAIGKAPTTISLTDLAQTYDGLPKPVSATTTPAGLAVALTYNGSATVPSAAGSYAVSATVNDPNHAGSAAGTLVIGKAPATISLTDLAQTYDGLPKPITATTTPAGLAVALTYNGSVTAPSAAGSYAISATVTDPNHAGSAAGTLVIDKAPATIGLTGLTQTYDGLPKPVGATTTPAALGVAITYDGSATPPTHAGSYAIAASINAANYAGSATGSLVIDKASAAIILTGIARTYDGTPKPATVTTTPAGLGVAITYDGSATPPTHAGSYAIAIAINDADGVGEATGTLVIDKASATIDLAGLTQTYDGTPKPVTATTTPAGLGVAISYEGSATPPTHAGSYAIAISINDADGVGETTGTLVIQKASATVILTGLARTYDGTPQPVTATTTPAFMLVWPISALRCLR